jgi:small conductance mechanosensitive channel
MTPLKDIDLKSVSWPDLIDSLLYEAFHLGKNLAICIIIYFVGRKIIKYINLGVGKLMSSKRIDPSVASFLKSLINIILTAALLIMIVNILGINNSSFVALLASVGVALGMALSGTLQNFSGGVMILLFRPYEIGDYIQAQGQEGTVKDIQIFNTVIITSDNRTIFIPNGGLSSNIIVNFNNQKTRRVEWVVGVDYGSDFDRVKEVVRTVLKTDDRILTDPAPLIVLKTLNESAIDIQIRVWVNRPDCWDVYYNINEQIYKTFAAQGIGIPFPQLTVHLEK